MNTENNKIPCEKSADSIKNEKTIEFLNKLYKNVNMASESLVALLPKTKDQGMRAEISMQISTYEKFADNINKMMFELNATPKDESLMIKTSAKVGIAMNTMIDSTSSHIAEMISEGSNMGIDDMLKNLRGYENQPVSEKSLSLARDIIKFEERNVDKMRSYL